MDQDLGPTNRSLKQQTASSLWSLALQAQDVQRREKTSVVESGVLVAGYTVLLLRMVSKAEEILLWGSDEDTKTEFLCPIYMIYMKES